MKNLRTEFGFSMIELVLASGISVILLFGLLGILLQMRSDLNGVAGYATRDALVRQARTVASDQNALRVTMNNTFAGNVYMSNCMRSNVANSCTSLSPVGIDLYDSGNMRIAGHQAMAGTAEDPVYYDREGFICPGGASDPKCTFKVTASFRAQCLPSYLSTDSIIPLATCSGSTADAFEITIVVTMVDQPNGVTLKPLQFSMISDFADYPFL